MLTNTAATTAQPTQTTATTIAIDDAEYRCRAALREIARLADAGQISGLEAADLETEMVAKLTVQTRELETYGDAIADAVVRSDNARRTEGPHRAAESDRPRSQHPGSLSARARALRERQMCVVASARVSIDVLRGLWLDDDEETLATRRELASAGLL
jgi:predicted S18 family serine protease